MKESAIKQPSIGVAVITHCAKPHLPRCLPPLLQSPLKPHVVVVNSSSHDGTVELAQQLGADTLVIPRAEFNHGLTREKARRYLNTDIVVMITPDAYALDVSLLETLILPLTSGKASVAYARQIPHDNADFFEAFARGFNYPAKSHIRGLEDISHYGCYTFFCSDSCAAYLNHALDEIGGFNSVLIGEDTVATAHLLQKGHKIAYVAEAIVKHSHSYTLKQEFQRYFDTGMARQSYSSLLAAAGSDGRRGASYVWSLMKKVVQERPFLLPYALAQSVAKWTGYQIGRKSLKAPLWFKKTFSGQKYYWST